MKQHLIAIAALALTSPPAAAEFRAGYGSWDYDLSGFVIDQGETFDFQRDLGLRAAGRGSLQLEFDTPKGWPDFAASYTQLGGEGQRSETTSIDIGPIVVPGPTRTLASDADFREYDLTARVPLRWSGNRLALGLSVKRLRGDLVIDDSNEAAPRRQDYDEVFPQLHARLRLPLGDFFSITGLVQGIDYQDSRALEYRATAELRLFQRLFVEGGWQEKRYEIALDNYRIDARLDGALLRFGFLLR